MISDTTKSPARRSVLPFLQYPLAVILALVLAIATSLSLSTSGAGINIVCGATGFIGVFFPSFLVSRPSRWLCSLFLSIVGSGFYYFRFIRQVRGEDPEVTLLQPASSIPPLICGALAATLIHFLTRRSKTLNATAAAPGS